MSLQSLLAQFKDREDQLVTYTEVLFHSLNDLRDTAADLEAGKIPAKGKSYKQIEKRFEKGVARVSDLVDEILNLFQDHFDQPDEEDLKFVCDDDLATESDYEVEEEEAEFTPEESEESAEELIELSSDEEF